MHNFQEDTAVSIIEKNIFKKKLWLAYCGVAFFFFPFLFLANEDVTLVRKVCAS